MKIGPSPNASPTSPAAATPATGAGSPALAPAEPARAGASTTEAPSAVDPSGRLALTGQARELVRSAAGEPPVRADKIAEVKLALAEGRFEANAERIARQMISEAASLLETMTRAR